MNRRTFFSTATLSTAAAVSLDGQAGGPVGRLVGSVLLPFEADISHDIPAARARNPDVDLCARMEEQHPADPGESSGAVLRIMDAGKYLSITATLGDTLHLLGWIEAPRAASLAAIDLRTMKGEVSFRLTSPNGQEACQGFSLTLLAGSNPELQLSIAGHCFGVLRGKLLTKFLGYLSARCPCIERAA